MASMGLGWEIEAARTDFVSDVSKRLNKILWGVGEVDWKNKTLILIWEFNKNLAKQF